MRIRASEPYIPNHRERLRCRQYTGHEHAEKANDLVVAPPLEEAGHAVRLQASDGLAALSTLLLSEDGNLCWCERRILPVADAV